MALAESRVQATVGQGPPYEGLGFGLGFGFGSCSCGQEPALCPGPLGSGGSSWISPQGRPQGCGRCS